MSQLSDVINKAAEEAMSDDGFDATTIAPKLWDNLDEASRKMVGVPEIVRQLKAAADRMAKRALKAMVSAQGELPFNLPGAVAMDTEGHKIKLTLKLKMLEFRRAIEIRRKQLKDDAAILKEFEAADKAFTPFWIKHPDWTAGQCLDAIISERKAKTSGRAA